MDDNQKELRRLDKEMAELKVRLERVERRLDLFGENVSFGLIRHIAPPYRPSNEVIEGSAMVEDQT